MTKRDSETRMVLSSILILIAIFIQPLWLHGDSFRRAAMIHSVHGGSRKEIKMKIDTGRWK